MPSIERLKHYTNNTLVDYTDTENKILGKLEMDYIARIVFLKN